MSSKDYESKELVLGGLYSMDNPICNINVWCEIISIYDDYVEVQITYMQLDKTETFSLHDEKKFMKIHSEEFLKNYHLIGI